MSAESLSPMDALPYFQPIAQSSTALTAGLAAQICAANPMRAALIISAIGNGNALIAPGQGVTVSKGIALTVQVPVFSITQRDYGSLVAQDWSAVTAATGITITVVEVLLKNWPAYGEVSNGIPALAVA